MIKELLLIWLVTIGLLTLLKRLMDFLQIKSDPFDQLRALMAKPAYPRFDGIDRVFTIESAMRLHKKQNKRLKDAKQKDIYLKIYEQILANVEVLNTYILHYNEESDKIKIQNQVATVEKLMNQLYELDNLYLELDAKATLADPNEIDDLIESLREVVEM